MFLDVIYRVIFSYLLISNTWSFEHSKSDDKSLSKDKYITKHLKGDVFTSISKEWKNGLQIQIIKSIEKRLNVNVNIKYSPFARRLMFMKTGGVDFIVGIQKTPDREKYIHFVNPPYKRMSNKVFFVLKGNKSKIKKYSDLYKFRIGTKIKSKYFKKFDNDLKIQKFQVSRLRQNFKQLLANRIDAVIYPAGAGLDKIKEMGISDKVETAEYYNYEKKLIYVGISKKSRLMKYIKDIENEMKKMVESGEIEKIIYEYYSRYQLAIHGYQNSQK